MKTVFLTAATLQQYIKQCRYAIFYLPVELADRLTQEKCR